LNLLLLCYSSKQHINLNSVRINLLELSILSLYIMSLSVCVPLRAKNMFDVSTLWNKDNYLVAVYYMVYDTNRRNIVDWGCSRVCGKNNEKRTIHAEELAIKYCMGQLKNNMKSKNRYKIVIWKFSKQMLIKPAICCSRCTKLARKYNFTRNMFTVRHDSIVSSIIANPIPSLGDRIRIEKRKKQTIINK
jgi:hypothetical protein